MATGSGIAGVSSGAIAAGATNSLIMTGNLNSTWSYSANFALGSYLTGGNYLQNPVDQFSSLGNMLSSGNYGDFASSIGNATMSYEFSRTEARLAQRWGMSPMDLNSAFMGASILGNELVGTRLTTGTGVNAEADKEFFPETNGLGYKGVLNRGVVGLPFDAIDILLGYQGLPTASIRDFVDSGLYGRPLTGHSLGTLDAINSYRYGLSSGGYLNSVPFGNVAPMAFQVNLGMGDVVNGGILGMIFNPGASLCPIGPTGHPMANYSSKC